MSDRLKDIAIATFFTSLLLALFIGVPVGIVTGSPLVMGILLIPALIGMFTLGVVLVFLLWKDVLS
jgi:uncharacterized membrane protein (Fun14 family)